MNNITGITNINQLTATISTGKTEKSDAFAKEMEKALSNIVETEKVDDANTEEILAGNIDNVASSMVDMVEADIALQFTMQVRNKIVDAYKEIMRMQI